MSTCLFLNPAFPPNTYIHACMYALCIYVHKPGFRCNGWFRQRECIYTHTHTHIHAYACACMQKPGFRCNGWSRHKASRWCARQRSMLLETARYSSTCRYLNPEPEMSLATARCFSTCRCLNPKPKPWQLLDAPQCAGA